MGSKHPKPKTAKYKSPLKELRDERDLTQFAIAEMIGVNLKSFREWERGYTYPAPEHLIALSKLFCVSTDYLLGETPYRNHGNEIIMEVTGLSEVSVEALRFFRTDSGDNDYDLMHHKTFEFINLILQASAQQIAEYRSAADPDFPVMTLFSTMMQYIETKNIALSYYDNGKRITLPSSIASLEFDDEVSGYTVAELGRIVLLNHITNTLEKMRTDRRGNNGQH